MDPLTAALNLATVAVTLATKIWDATPEPLKAQESANWAQFIINIGSFINQAQAKINAMPMSGASKP